MATQDDTKPCDSLPPLADAYDALALLLAEREPDSEFFAILAQLNRDLRGVVDGLDARGLLS